MASLDSTSDASYTVRSVRQWLLSWLCCGVWFLCSLDMWVVDGVCCEVCSLLSATSALCVLSVFFFKQKTAYWMRISDWSSDVCSSDLEEENEEENPFKRAARKIGTAPLPKGPGRVIARNEGALPNFRTTFLYGANAAIEGLDLAPMSVADVLTPEILRIVIDVQHERQCKRAVERGEAVIPSKKSGTLKNTVAHFKAMATDLGVDAALIEEMDCLYDEVHPDFIRWKRGKDGKPKRKYSTKRMGSRHSRMLKQFVRDGGDRNILAWCQLPKQPVDRASRKCRAGEIGRAPCRERGCP